MITATNNKMPKKSNLEKAFPAFGKGKHTICVTCTGGNVILSVEGGNLVANSSVLTSKIEVENASVGELLKFTHEATQLHNLNFVASDLGEPAITPGNLAGSASGKGRNFEQVLMDATKRLENSGVATMGRYPVASVMMKGSKFPMQVSSLPDFEGVLASGKQFIWEAKVCTQPSFRIVKDKIKHKQVRHMLLRSQFGVLCHLVIHFNERLGKTFYDPAFTVAIPVKPVSMGGWPIWEQFSEASKKDKAKEFASITREMARDMGVVMPWAIPGRCKNPYPDLEKILHKE